MPVTVKILPRSIEAVIDHTGPYAELSGVYAELVEWITFQGWYPMDNGTSLYWDDPSMVPAHLLRSQARITVNVHGRVLPAPPPGECQAYLERREPTLVIATQFTGPYDEIIPTYALLHRELGKHKLEYAGPMLETYLNIPTDTPPEKLETLVQLVVQPRGKVDICIYADWGGYEAGVEAASLAFTAAGLTVMPVMAEDINDGSFAKKARAIYMPGGWAEHYTRDITDEGARHLEHFIAGGGGYIGTCAGSYYAAKQIVWADVAWPYDIDLFPGTPEGPIKEIAPWPGYATTEINVDTSHPITAGGPSTRTVLYYGGPVFTCANGADVAVLATYKMTGDPAMVAFGKGEGRVFLTSPHLEFDLTGEHDNTDWPENEKGFDDPESDWDLLQAAGYWVAGKELPQ